MTWYQHLDNRALLPKLIVLSEEIPRPSWKPSADYRVYNREPVAPIVSKKITGWNK
jgi:hypothetical protein